MKNNEEIKKFIQKYININQDRLNNAKKKVNPTDGSLITFLNNNLGDSYKESLYQGSFSYHTIVKPNLNDESGEYDVDIAIRLKYNEDFDGEEYKYHDLLLDCFKGSDRYKDKLDTSKERAVRIKYDSNDGEFHVDLVPMFLKGNTWKVIDRKNNVVEISGGTEFRDWVNEQNNKTSTESDTRKYLKEAIRIFKFLRNQSDYDLIRSVQLTLLLSRQVDKLEDSSFDSISTTLLSLSGKLKEELEGIEDISDLDLSNPGLPEETFDRKFHQDDFDRFKDWFIDIAEKIDIAYNEEDRDKSITKWQDIFGEDFVSDTSSKDLALYDYNHKESVESNGFTRATDMQELKITAQRISKYNSLNTPFASGTTIPNHQILEYYVKIPFDKGDSELIWQVTNENNSYVNSKRGELRNENTNLGYVSRNKGYGIREEGSWKGRHLVKCYLVTPYNCIIAESEEFVVKIG